MNITSRPRISDLLSGTHYHEAAQIYIDRGIAPFWRGRLEGMIEYASHAGLSAPGCTRLNAAFTRIRISRNWPRKGSAVVLDRTDGTRWKLHLEPGHAGQFRVDMVNAWRFIYS